MTPATHAALALIRDQLATIERDVPPKLERPRKHAVTVVWCEGDEPHDATVSATCPRFPEFPDEVSFARKALDHVGLLPSPAPDELARCRRALVELASATVRDRQYSGRTGGYATKLEATVAVCRDFKYPITPAEVEAILAETAT